MDKDIIYHKNLREGNTLNRSSPSKDDEDSYKMQGRRKLIIF